MPVVILHTLTVVPPLHRRGGRLDQFLTMPSDLSESLLSGSSAAAKLASWQRTVFIVTFVNYAMAHFSRKCYTNVKTDLVEAGVDKIILSQMDTAFMFTCAARSYSLA